MQKEYTRLFYVCVKSLKLQTGSKPCWKMDCLLCVCLKSSRPLLTLLKVFSNVIRLLLPLFVICRTFQHIHPVLRYFSLKTLLHRCPLTILECPLSVLERCPSNREFNYSKMTKQMAGTNTRCAS